MTNAIDRDYAAAAALDGVLSRRMLAFVIDYALVCLLLLPAAVLVFILGVLTLGLAFYLFPVLFFVVAGLYFALSLSSRSQATPGMRVMDLTLVSDSGFRTDFMTGLLHVILFWVLNSFLTPFILLVGLFTNRKRLLHDIALGTVLMRASRLDAPRF
ncbi:RDD family protein [Rhizobium sp. FKL33]|uniref:RDD family protein n=1 Tax=Rhizobium sp. FKL33 TaxID=2562307 RepID=UPI0010C0A68C|nr:RDD family protein [Rhizobium sp. FKL33]